MRRRRSSRRIAAHALDDAAWQAWLRTREQRRHHPLPVPAYLSTAGVAPSDAVGVRRVLAAHVDKPLDLPSVEKDLSALSGLIVIRRSSGK